VKVERMNRFFKSHDNYIKVTQKLLFMQSAAGEKKSQSALEQSDNDLHANCEQIKLIEGFILFFEKQAVTFLKQMVRADPNKY